LAVSDGGSIDFDDGKSEYGLGIIGLYFKAGIELPIGFNAYLKPQFAISTYDFIDTEFHAVVIGLGYQIIEPVRADLDVTIPIGTKDNGTNFDRAGLTIAPKVSATFGAIGAYLGAEIGRIGADIPKKQTISFKLTLGASYSF
jgi:hypothetical protein